MGQRITGRMNRELKTHKGMEIEEVVIRGWTATQDQILWVRECFDDRVVDGKPNPCIGVSFTPIEDSDMPLVQAREQVRRKFEEYWQL